jgi:probable selenium-dependent hydroxylase accessory protein YqeC
MTLVEALAADGIVCVVGAGGKKTTLYTLAERIDRAVVTATVRIPVFDPHVARVVVTADPVPAVHTATDWPVGVVRERERADRYAGYDPGTVGALADADADAVLVKGDGARTRQFKAPGDREPQLPAATETVIPVVSARVVGKPLSEDAVHRVDRVADLTGLEPGEPIQASDVATVLASDRGGRKDVPADATVVPLVNMVDNGDLESIGRDIADAVLDRADVPRVVLAQMTAEYPEVAVVE